MDLARAHDSKYLPKRTVKTHISSQYVEFRREWKHANHKDTKPQSKKHGFPYAQERPSPPCYSCAETRIFFEPQSTQSSAEGRKI